MTAPESSTEVETGRFRQRRRTRAAIVDAASEILRAGRTPSVNEIADAAEVSRRTVYQYFPTVEQLLLDATLGLLSQTAVDEAIDSVDGGTDARERVTAMIKALNEMSAETLPLGRSLIRLTVGTPGDVDQPIRGYRRVGWIERAIDPLRSELSEQGFERLVSALAMVIGWEALIVLQDLRGLSAPDQEATAQWAAAALIQAALADP
jgi:AcrR family transcriptional regulator